MSMIAAGHLRRGDRLAMGGEVSRREPRAGFTATHTFLVLDREDGQEWDDFSETVNALNSYRPTRRDRNADGANTTDPYAGIVIVPNDFLVQVTNR